MFFAPGTTFDRAVMHTDQLGRPSEQLRTFLFGLQAWL